MPRFKFSDIVANVPGCNLDRSVSLRVNVKSNGGSDIVLGSFLDVVKVFSASISTIKGCVSFISVEIHSRGVILDQIEGQTIVVVMVVSAGFRLEELGTWGRPGVRCGPMAGREGAGDTTCRTRDNGKGLFPVSSGIPVSSQHHGMMEILPPACFRSIRTSSGDGDKKNFFGIFFKTVFSQ
jgi:hypothetical protein